MPHEHLRAVAALADEREQMTAERVQVPALDDGDQAVVTGPHVHGLRRQVHAHLRRQREHRSAPQCVHERGDVRDVGAEPAPNDHSADRDLHRPLRRRGLHGDLDRLDRRRPVLRTGGFKGYVQADAANLYDRLYAAVEVGCWAHARRRYIERS